MHTSLSRGLFVSDALRKSCRRRLST